MSTNTPQFTRDYLETQKTTDIGRLKVLTSDKFSDLQYSVNSNCNCAAEGNRIQNVLREIKEAGGFSAIARILGKDKASELKSLIKHRVKLIGVYRLQKMRPVYEELYGIQKAM